MKSTDIFNIDIPGRRPERGCLLVAEPFLREKWFNHAVIFMLDYEGARESSMGVVLNHETATTIWDVVEEPAPKGANADVHVWCGGPVGTNRLYFLHTLGPEVIPEAQQLNDGLWLGGDFEAAKTYLRDGYPAEGNIRFFVGYSGWDPGQLDREILEKVWAVAPCPEAMQRMLEGEGDIVWHRAVRSLGDDYKAWRLHPQAPWVN